MSLKVPFIEQEIIDQYLYDDNPRPWIIGFSGGKDSTMLLFIPSLRGFMGGENCFSSTNITYYMVGLRSSRNHSGRTSKLCVCNARSF